jgi:hypothetical protein
MKRKDALSRSFGADFAGLKDVDAGDRMLGMHTTDHMLHRLRRTVFTKERVLDIASVIKVGPSPLDANDNAYKNYTPTIRALAAEGKLVSISARVDGENRQEQEDGSDENENENKDEASVENRQQAMSQGAQETTRTRRRIEDYDDEELNAGVTATPTTFTRTNRETDATLREEISRRLRPAPSAASKTMRLRRFEQLMGCAFQWKLAKLPSNRFSLKEQVLKAGNDSTDEVVFAMVRTREQGMSGDDSPKWLEIVPQDEKFIESILTKLWNDPTKANFRGGRTLYSVASRMYLGIPYKLVEDFVRKQELSQMLEPAAVGVFSPLVPTGLGWHQVDIMFSTWDKAEPGKAVLSEVEKALQGDALQQSNKDAKFVARAEEKRRKELQKENREQNFEQIEALRSQLKELTRQQKSADDNADDIRKQYKSLEKTLNVSMDRYLAIIENEELDLSDEKAKDLRINTYYKDIGKNKGVDNTQLEVLLQFQTKDGEVTIDIWENVAENRKQQQALLDEKETKKGSLEAKLTSTKKSPEKETLKRQIREITNEINEDKNVLNVFLEEVRELLKAKAKRGLQTLVVVNKEPTKARKEAIKQATVYEDLLKAKLSKSQSDAVFQGTSKRQYEITFNEYKVIDKVLIAREKLILEFGDKIEELKTKLEELNGRKKNVKGGESEGDIPSSRAWHDLLLEGGIGKLRNGKDGDKNPVASPRRRRQKIDEANDAEKKKKRKEEDEDADVHVEAEKPKVVKRVTSYPYIMNVMDIYSKYAWSFPLRKADAENVCESLERLWLQEGPPKFLQSDGGFLSEKLIRLADRFGVERRVCAPYHSQCSGAIERLNRTIRESIKKARYGLQEAGKPAQWVRFLPHIVSSYNAITHSTTLASPYLVQRGREPRMHVAALRAGLSAKEKSELTGLKEIWGENLDEPQANDAWIWRDTSAPRDSSRGACQLGELVGGVTRKDEDDDDEDDDFYERGNKPGDSKHARAKAAAEARNPSERGEKGKKDKENNNGGDEKDEKENAKDNEEDGRNILLGDFLMRQIPKYVNEVNTDIPEDDLPMNELELGDAKEWQRKSVAEFVLRSKKAQQVREDVVNKGIRHAAVGMTADALVKAEESLKPLELGTLVRISTAHHRELRAEIKAGFKRARDLNTWSEKVYYIIGVPGGNAGSDSASKDRPHYLVKEAGIPADSDRSKTLHVPRQSLLAVSRVPLSAQEFEELKRGSMQGIQKHVTVRQNYRAPTEQRGLVESWK